jgi:hypothetical protein
MKFVYKWLYKKLETIQHDAKLSNAVEIGSSRSIDSNGMNFSVYRANGGHIIEARKYDRKRDCNDHSLHIITDDKDLGEEIGKIITFENLRS